MLALASYRHERNSAEAGCYRTVHEKAMLASPPCLHPNVCVSRQQFLSELYATCTKIGPKIARAHGTSVGLRDCPEKVACYSMVIFEGGGLCLSGCRSLIESSGSGEIVSDDSDLVCLHEGYVDGLHLA